MSKKQAPVTEQNVMGQICRRLERLQPKRRVEMLKYLLGQEEFLVANPPEGKDERQEDLFSTEQ